METVTDYILSLAVHKRTHTAGTFEDCELELVGYSDPVATGPLDDLLEEVRKQTGTAKVY